MPFDNKFQNQAVISAEQGANVAPPRRGAVIALSVDSTARAYDITALTFGGLLPATSQYVVIALQGGAASVFYHFSPTNAATLDNTAVIAAGGALAYANTYGTELPAAAVHQVRLDRTIDSYLVVKTASGTATLRLWGASDAI